MRLSRVDSLAGGVDPDSVRLRVGGWPVAGETRTVSEPGSVTLTGPGGLRSVITGARGNAYQKKEENAGPLGPTTHIPCLEHEVRVGAWVTTFLALTRAEGTAGERVEWPDENDIYTLLSTILKE
jgi:hypothetical protein